MKAAAMHGVNDVQYGEVPDPKIDSDRDVIVKIGGAGVCRTDLHTLQGELAWAFGLPEAPYVLGHENAGWIEETGSAVTGLTAGQPVLAFPQITCRRCRPCRRGQDMHCEAPRFPGVDAVTWGGFSEYLRTSADCIVPLPEGAHVTAFAPYADAGLAAYHAVLGALPRLGVGSTVVVIGIGGLGQFAVSLVKLLTTSFVVGVDVSDAKAAKAIQFGADKTVVSSEEEPTEAVREFTHGKGADVVLDFVGADDTPSTAVGMLSMGGIYSIVGYGGQLQLDTVQAMVRELTIAGSFVGTHDELVDLVALSEHGLRNEVEVYDLADAPSVLEHLDNGHITSRAVLVP